MNASSILDIAKSSGIGLFVVDGKLRVEAPVGRLTPELRGEIASRKAEIIEALAADTALSKFKAEFRRLSKRLSRVMNERDRGYLEWTQLHESALWRRLEATRQAWDTNERLESLKTGRITWRDYRRLMLTWARLNVEAIRRHRRA